MTAFIVNEEPSKVRAMLSGEMREMWSTREELAMAKAAIAMEENGRQDRIGMSRIQTEHIVHHRPADIRAPLGNHTQAIRRLAITVDRKLMAHHMEAITSRGLTTRPLLHCNGQCSSKTLHRLMVGMDMGIAIMEVSEVGRLLLRIITLPGWGSIRTTRQHYHLFRHHTDRQLLTSHLSPLRMLMELLWCKEAIRVMVDTDRHSLSHTDRLHSKPTGAQFCPHIYRSQEVIVDGINKLVQRYCCLIPYLHPRQFNVP